VPAAEEKPPSHEQDEILELTDVVDDDGTVVSLTAGAQSKPAAEPPASKRPPPSDSGLDTAPLPTPRIVPDPEPPPSPKPVPMSDDTANRLVSGATAAASVAALSQLGAIGQRDRPGDIALGELGRTLEEVVRELLRPLLKDWLDANLPYLVERLVQEEIQRMVREAQGR
jgi:cell pole-organizing protein PopZ